MSKQLPNRPNLKHLRNQARQLLDAHKAGNDDACTRFKTHLPRLNEASPQQIRGAKLTLRDAQLVIAREYDFASWSKLKRHLEDHAVITTPDASHKALLGRVAGLVGEHTEDAAKTVRRMLEQSDQIAIALIALGQENTAAIMKHLSDSEIEQIAQSISNIDTVTTEGEDEVLESFEQLLMADKYVSQGGLEYARGALEKAVGERKAQAILKRLNAQYDTLLIRVKRLASERPEDVARILAHENETQAALIARELGEETMEPVVSHLPNAINKDIAETTIDIPIEEKAEALEDFERLAVALKYITDGGIQFARGALAKALGNRRAQAVLDRIISISGFLQLQTMTPEQVCDVLSDEPPETIASALSQLDASHAIQVFNGLNTEVQNHIAKQMATQTPLSEDERRQLDHRLADKHLTL